MEFPKPRRSARVKLPQRLPAFLDGVGNVEVLNLSPTGAMVEHTTRLVPGGSRSFTLTLAGVALRLQARVVWSEIHKATRGPSGHGSLRFRSGLLFVSLAEAAEAHLRQCLATLTSPASQRSPEIE